MSNSAQPVTAGSPVSAQQTPQVYESSFPGTEDVPLAQVFSKPGYNEPSLGAPAWAWVSAILTSLGWIFPPFSWGLSAVSFPIALSTWLAFRKKWRYRSGQVMTRGAAVVSAFTFFCLLLTVLLWILYR